MLILSHIRSYQPEIVIPASLPQAESRARMTVRGE